MKTTDPVQQGYVYVQPDLKTQALGTLLGKVFPQGAYWLGTSPERADLAHAVDKAAVAALPATWPAGRAFSSTAEVRWEQQKTDGYTVWLLGENLSTEVSALVAELGMEPIPITWVATAATAPIYLWGQYLPDSEDIDLKPWLEVRVPHRLAYPVKQTDCQANSFVGIGYLHYAAPNGAVQFTRLTALRIINLKTTTATVNQAQTKR